MDVLPAEQHGRQLPGTPRGRRKNPRPPRPGAPSSGPLSGFSGPLAKLSDKLRTGGSSKKLAVLPDNLVSNKV